MTDQTECNNAKQSSGVIKTNHSDNSSHTKFSRKFRNVSITLLPRFFSPPFYKNSANLCGRKVGFINLRAAAVQVIYQQSREGMEW